MVSLCFNNASATWYISASLPVNLNMFTQCKTNRLLVCVYPFVASILSMLGEKNPAPGLPRCPIEKGSPVNSQCPVQRFAPHSNVNSNGMFFFLARCFVDSMVGIHG